MKRYCLSSGERIRRPAEFQRVYRRGKRFATSWFVWFYEGGKASSGRRRLGVTVTKEIGKANQRNRIKRQVREFFRLNKHALPEGDFVIKARMGAGGAKNSELRKDLENGIKRI